MQCPDCAEELAVPEACDKCGWKDTTPLPEESSTEPEDVQEPIPESEQLCDEEPAGNDTVASDILEQENRSDDEEQAESESQPAKSSGSVNFRDTTVSPQGDLIAIGQAILQIQEVAQKAEQEKSLYEVTKAFPQRNINLSRFLLKELDNNVTKLRQDQVILVSCYNKKYALDAAQAIVERLNIPHQEQKRLLYFESPAWETSEISIHSLMEKRVDSQQENVIIVDTLEDSAETFCESLFVSDLKTSMIKDELKKKNLLLLCIVESTYIERSLKEEGRELNFPDWRIPFLLPLLEQHFGDKCEQLNKEILRQQEQNGWSKDEGKFFFEITSYINNNQLLDLVAEGGRPDRVPVASLVEQASPIGKIVLYVATYFPNTTPMEFCRIVESLLAERTSTVATQTYTSGENGALQTIQSERQVPLARIWDECKDKIVRQWLLEMISPRDSTRVVSFNDPAMRDSLKEYFEKEHRFYLIDQFNIIQNQRILFHPSFRIAESANRIAIDLMLNYPDEYDAMWLVSTIINLKQKLDAETDGSENLTPQLRRIPQRLALRWAYNRISELMSRMFEHPQLRDCVDSCLDGLIKIKSHDWAFNIIKALRSAPEFDGFYWMKRLLDQADEKTRDQAYYYLLSYLKKVDTNIYEVLGRLETWIPGEDRNPQSYSLSNRFALRLLIQYFLETTAKFDHKYYGAWPSRYVLFEVKNKADATEALALLTRWLFHPGLKYTLRSMKLEANPYSLIATLLAEWSFILLGPGTTSEPDAKKSESSEADLDPVGLLDLLLEQISLKVDIFQRAELLNHWDKLGRDLLKFIASYLRPNNQPKELIWKRECVRELAKRFKGMTARLKAS